MSHYMLLVELEPLDQINPDTVNAAVEKAMAPFYSDCPNPTSADQVAEYDRDYPEEAPHALCTEHKRHVWDWWVIGGRYRDRLQVRPGVTEVVIGRPGVPEAMAIRDGEIAYTVEGVDAARKRDIDWEGMAAKRNADARKAWDEAEAKGEDGFIRRYVYGIHDGETKDEYVARMTRSFSTHAVLTRTGLWVPRETFIYVNEPGKSRFEETPDWDRKWDEMVAAMPDDAVLVIVDYHN